MPSTCDHVWVDGAVAEHDDPELPGSRGTFRQCAVCLNGSVYLSTPDGRLWSRPIRETDVLDPHDIVTVKGR